MKTGILIIAAIIALPLATRSADVKENWEKHCAKCHAADGSGNTKMGKKLNIKNYTDAKAQAEFTDEAAFKAIKEGIKDKNGAARMKPIEGLSDDEAKALVQFVRSFKK